MFNEFLNQISPKCQAPLDPNFKPAFLFQKKYQELLSDNQRTSLAIALQRSEQATYRFQIEVLENPQFDEITSAYLQFNIKFMLWAVGGHTLSMSGPKKWFEVLKESFSETGKFAFDANFMSRIYQTPWQVEHCSESELPKESRVHNTLGGHLNGCRIGFDLGASDYKLAAVKDGEALFTTEIRWDPVPQADPDYHWSRIVEGLELAASHLPQVDAIGGSSAGIIHDNKIMVASLFRSVPEKDFLTKVTPIFEKLKEKWQVPFVTVNDGDVSALAGALSTKEKGILGVAMGSSEAVGYLNMEGEITGQLNELAFAPIEYNPQAPKDEWSKAPAAGVMYFSQQAVNRLALQMGMTFPEEMLLPERLKQVQAKMNGGDQEVAKIYETIGTYLGYTLPLYGQFYDIKKLMVFGRVMSGLGGDKIIEVANQVLKTEFPEWSEKVKLAIPDEEFRRVGQAVAAASLPEFSG